MPTGNILDSYAHAAPSVQAALDIFKGEWASCFPAALGTPVLAGGIPLFEDNRIVCGVEQLGGIAGDRVLELGPLEGGHSYMMEAYGAESVVAIEANSRAYLKCLIAKEVLAMKRVKYLYGDFVEYLKSAAGRYDLILASGVLYHMRNPVELLALLASHTDRVLLWTHYVDDSIASNKLVKHKFPSRKTVTEAGFSHTLYRHEYQASLNHIGFYGGNEDYSSWMNRADLLGAIAHVGFRDVRIGPEALDHPLGPCFTLVATK